MARDRQGDTATYIYPDNLKSAIAAGGDVVNQLIPFVFDTARTIRVLGANEQQKLQRVNDPMDPNSIDLAKGKYDIVVETGPSYSTKRVEAAESMMAFVQAVPAAAQVAGDLIAMAQDWPLAEEIGERLKKTLPPGIAEEDDPEKMTPEQQQAKAQAAQQAQIQQQMQMQGAQLELAEMEANVLLAHAKVDKLKAEAQNVGAQEPETPIELRLQLAELDIANANARKAEAEADKAEAEVPKAHASAMREEIGITSDALAAESAAMDLDNKPTEQDLARQTTEKALKEPPKTATKPKA